MNISEICSKADKWFYEFTIKSFEERNKDASELLSLLSGGLDKITLELKSDAKVRTKMYQYWKVYEEHSSNVLSVLSSNNFIENEEFFKNLDEEFESDVNDFLSDYSKQVKLDIGDDFWTVQKENSFKTRNWKRYRKSKLFLRKKRNGIRNFFRKVFKKEPVPFNPEVRKVSICDYLRYYYFIPQKEYLVKNWQRYFRSISDTVAEIHETSKKLQKEILFFDKFVEVCSENPEIDYEKATLKLTELKELILSLIEKRKPWFEDLIDGCKKREEELKFVSGKQWNYAGTYILKNSCFNEKRQKISLKVIDNLKNKTINAWSNYITAEVDDWKKDLELIILQLKVSLLCIDTLNIVKNKVKEKIIPNAEDLKKMLFESVEKIKSFDAEEKDLKKKLLLESRKLLKTLRQEKLQALFETVTQSNLDEIAKLFIDRMKESASSVSPQHVLLLQRDKNSTIPVFKREDVPFKDLIYEEIFKHIEKKYKRFSQGVVAHQERILRRINDIDNIIETNFDAAINILKEENVLDVSDAVSIGVEGLERTASVVVDLVDEFKGVSKDTRQFLPEISGQFIKNLESLSDTTKVLELKLILLKNRTNQEIRQIFTSTWDRFVVIGKGQLENSKKLLKEIKQRIFKIKKITGLVTEDEQIGFGFTQYLNMTSRKIDKLPYVYKRLFSWEPLSSRGFMCGRKREINIIKQDYNLWKDGAVVSTVLTGEKGSGKTTILNVAESESFSNKDRIVKINFVETILDENLLYKEIGEAFGTLNCSSFEELENILLREDSKSVCYVENIQNIFVRNINGFNAIERFMLLISRTQRNIFWVVTCGKYAFEYLDKVLQISRHFQRILDLGPLTAKEVEDIIILRHSSSGYDLVFDEPESMRDHKKYKQLSSSVEKQSFIKDIYFKNLASISAGNVLVAIMLWQNSIKEVTKDKVKITTYIVSNYAFISNLPRSELFALAAFVHHDKLSLPNFVKVLRGSEKSNARLLESLYNNGILLKEKNEFYIHRFLYRSVVKTLKSKKILH